MTKDIQWLKKWLNDYENGTIEELWTSSTNDYLTARLHGALSLLKEVKQRIDQLDEPEVLSQEWIDEHTYYVHDRESSMVYAIDLQNLLVPKQEELESKIQELIEAYKQEDGQYSNPENAWIGEFIEDLENLLEEEQKYYAVKREGLDGVHYYFAKFDDEMTGLFTLPNDKKGAYRFDDKEKAQAIANYTDSKVEELEE